MDVAAAKQYLQKLHDSIQPDAAAYFENVAPYTWNLTWHQKDSTWHGKDYDKTCREIARYIAALAEKTGQKQP